VRDRFLGGPASTLVQVVRRARPEWLIEIEAVAVIEEERRVRHRRPVRSRHARPIGIPDMSGFYLR
jgi:hypothetical protein